MAKIVLSMDGVVLQEMVLSKERITIGRRPHNDLVIDNSAISAEHAVIMSMLEDAFLEDLSSTNGTTVNGQAVKKYFLKNNDIIELAGYIIRFIGADNSQDNKPVFPSASNKITSKASINSINAVVQKRVYLDGTTVMLAGSATLNNAIVKMLSGPNAGNDIAFNKSLTSIGLPGLQVAVVIRHDESYSLTMCRELSIHSSTANRLAQVHTQ
jgi:hypothetical protein